MDRSHDPGSGDQPRRTSEADPVPADDFFRGGGAVATEPALGSQLRPTSLDVARPPAWTMWPSFLIGALAGLFAFSGIWTALGGGPTAVLPAALGGIVVVSGTTLAGGLLWTHVNGESAADRSA